LLFESDVACAEVKFTAPAGKTYLKASPFAGANSRRALLHILQPAAVSIALAGKTPPEATRMNFERMG
jgi:hypothetical protein